MNLTALLVSVIALALAFLGNAVIVARWSARLQTLVEIHSDEIGLLRAAGTNVSTRLASLEGRVDERREGASG